MRISTPITTGLAVSAPALQARRTTVPPTAATLSAFIKSPVTVFSTPILPRQASQEWKEAPTNSSKNASSSTVTFFNIDLDIDDVVAEEPYNAPVWPPDETYVCLPMPGQTVGISPDVPLVPMTGRFCNTNLPYQSKVAAMPWESKPEPKTKDSWNPLRIWPFFESFDKIHKRQINPPKEADPAVAGMPYSTSTPAELSSRKPEFTASPSQRPYKSAPQPPWFVGNQTGIVPRDYSGTDLGDGHDWLSWDEMQTETWHPGTRDPVALYSCIGHYLQFVAKWEKDPRSKPLLGGWETLDLAQGWPCKQANVAFRIVGGDGNVKPHYSSSVPLSCRMGARMVKAIREGVATYSCRVKTKWLYLETQDFADFMWWPIGGPPPPYPYRGTVRGEEHSEADYSDFQWENQYGSKPPP